MKKNQEIEILTKQNKILRNKLKNLGNNWKLPMQRFTSKSKLIIWKSKLTLTVPYAHNAVGKKDTLKYLKYLMNTQLV